MANVARHMTVTSIDELEAVATSVAGMAPKVSRSTTSLRAERVTIEIDGAIVEVEHYSFPYVTEGQSPPGRVGFATPLRHCVTYLNGEAALPGLLHSYGELAEVRGAATEPSAFGMLSLPITVVHETAVALGVDIDLPGRGEFRVLRAREWERLRRLFERSEDLAYASASALLDPRQAQELSAAIRELAVYAFERDPSPRVVSAAHLNSMHITHVCEEYAEAMQYHDVTMTALCRASGVSERRVRQAFYDAYQMSPTAYLRIAALHALRHALRAGPPTRDAVSRAAADLGFWHMGHMAGHYRALFGEKPSDTLRVARHGQPLELSRVLKDPGDAAVRSA